MPFELAVGRRSDCEHVQRIDAVIRRAGELIARRCSERLFEPGERFSGAPARVSASAALEQVTDTHARRLRVEYALHGIERAVGIVESALQSLCARNLRGCFERLARVRRMSRSFRAKPRFGLRRMVEIPQRV